MKYCRLLLVVLVFAAFVPLAFSQDTVITLKHPEMGKHERPIVDFNHEKHAAKIDCLQCHHDYDAYMNNRGGDGQACGTCHGPAAKDGLISLKDAFHVQCKSCHESMQSQGKPSGAVTCGECHVRK
ncbi:MAG: cytochrome c3 family protein [Syntrophobacteraceae bacterium]